MLQDDFIIEKDNIKKNEEMNKNGFLFFFKRQSTWNYQYKINKYVTNTTTIRMTWNKISDILKKPAFSNLHTWKNILL